MASPKTNTRNSEEISLSKLADIFRKRWYFVPIFMVVAIAMSAIYLRYSKPIYQATGTVKVETYNNPMHNLGLFRELNNFNSNIEAEIEIIKSVNLVQRALEKMDVKVSYYLVGTVLTAELYRSCPFKVIFDETKPPVYDRMFSLEAISENEFRLGWAEGEQEIFHEYNFGESVKIGEFEIRVVRMEETPRYLVPGQVFKFRFNRISGLISRAMSSLAVEQMGFMVSIIKISSTDFVPGFASDLVNALSHVYLEQDSAIKTRAASQAVDFIESQLDTIQIRVQQSELMVQAFKQDKQIVDVEKQGMNEIEKLIDYETIEDNLELTTRLIDSLLSQLDDPRIEWKKFNFDFEQESNKVLDDLTSGYNAVAEDLEKLTEKYPPTAREISELKKQQVRLREDIRGAVTNIRTKNENRLNHYRDNIRKVKLSLLEVPSLTRQLINLEREYKVNESVFNTLLEKRAESQIARASIVSAVRIIDQAIEPTVPISPVKPRIYSIGLGMGISFGLIIILLSGLLKNTISYKEEIESIARTPLIGVVRRSPASLHNKYPKLAVIENPKSALSESIRAIRTNLQFVTPGEGSKMIAITSTVSGEGKSFITINLAGIISLLDKRVVILDLDLRKPKLHFTFGVDNSKGLSTYLVGKSTYEEVLIETEYPKLDIITSGPIPPNPAELLQSDRMKDLMQSLRSSYDYILVDTPPIGLVTDGMSLIRVADISLYVVRSDYSKRSYVQIPDQMGEEQQIKNLYLVLNSVHQSGGKYGKYGKYGTYGRSASGYYIDDKEKKSWWNFWSGKS